MPSKKVQLLNEYHQIMGFGLGQQPSTNGDTSAAEAMDSAAAATAPLTMGELSRYLLYLLAAIGGYSIYKAYIAMRG